MTDRIPQIRQLTLALIASGIFNVFLVSFLIYLLFGERPPTPYCELKPADLREQQSPLAIDHSNSEVIRYFRKMPLEWLLTRLKNAQQVESGYTQRELALACLVAFHHFDLNKALAGQPLPEQKRYLAYGKWSDGRPAELLVYPGLPDKYFDAIISFAAKERWPLTHKGLFLALRRLSPNVHDTSLVDAFMMTPHFLAVEMLFNRGEASVDKMELLSMLLQGDWELLNTFVEQQKVSQDLSPARRQRFLLDYIQKNSKTAAYIILKTDGQFAANKLDNAHVMLLLKLLDERRPESERFALATLASPRSDEVWKMAANRLYEYVGESAPDKDYHRAALARFVPQHSLLEAAEASSQPLTMAVSPLPPVPIPKKIAASKPPILKTTPPNKSSTRLYVIQEGDSLWKISRRFNVDIDQLRKSNKLTSDILQPGSSLKIP